MKLSKKMFMQPSNQEVHSTLKFLTLPNSLWTLQPFSTCDIPLVICQPKRSTKRSSLKKNFAMSEQKNRRARFYGWEISFCLILFSLRSFVKRERKKFPCWCLFFQFSLFFLPFPPSRRILSRVKMFVEQRTRRKNVEKRKISLKLVWKLLSKGFSPRRLSSFFVMAFCIIKRSWSELFKKNGRPKSDPLIRLRFPPFIIPLRECHSRRTKKFECRATKGETTFTLGETILWGRRTSRNRMLGFISIDFQFSL